MSDTFFISQYLRCSVLNTFFHPGTILISFLSLCNYCNVYINLNVHNETTRFSTKYMSSTQISYTEYMECNYSFLLETVECRHHRQIYICPKTVSNETGTPCAAFSNCLYSFHIIKYINILLYLLPCINLLCIIPSVINISKHNMWPIQLDIFFVSVISLLLLFCFFNCFFI